MSQFVNKKVLLVALSSAILVMTGCSTKERNSRVVVSPYGTNGAMGANGGIGGNGYYDGGALVGNDQSVIDAANGLQSTVYFAFDSSAISNKSANTLDQHASLLGSNQGSRVLVVGHTDPRGSREYNMALGERRAAAVRDYLANKGIDTANVEITSRGEEELTGNYDTDRRAVLSY
ncbi:MAG: OmpA family protein [Moraxellaceae bacterium]|nr:OmpA family protein [Moraxellaceae bacterium]